MHPGESELVMDPPNNHQTLKPVVHGTVTQNRCRSGNGSHDVPDF